MDHLRQILLFHSSSCCSYWNTLWRISSCFCIISLHNSHPSLFLFTVSCRLYLLGEGQGNSLAGRQSITRLTQWDTFHYIYSDTARLFNVYNSLVHLGSVGNPCKHREGIHFCKVFCVFLNDYFSSLLGCGQQGNSFCTQYTALSVCLCAFVKCSQGKQWNPPATKLHGIQLYGSDTVTSLCSLGCIPPPSDHLALRHCEGKCGYSPASHSSLREQLGKAAGAFEREN